MWTNTLLAGALSRNLINAIIQTSTTLFYTVPPSPLSLLRRSRLGLRPVLPIQPLCGPVEHRFKRLSNGRSPRTFNVDCWSEEQSSVSVDSVTVRGLLDSETDERRLFLLGEKGFWRSEEMMGDVGENLGTQS